MPRYWIDSSVFITAKDTMFAFDINVSFWSWVDGALRRGDVGSPKQVFDEVVKGVKDTDRLAEWVRTRKKFNLCVDPNRDVYEALKKISNYVFTSGRYKYSFALDFARQSADSWIIAFAMGYGGKVVTQESDKRGADCRRVRIPDVCDHFNVECVKVWDMLRELDVKL